MSVVKNIWTEFSTAPGQNVNLQSGGTFTYSDLNSVYNGAGPTKGGLPLNDGDTFAWNNADVTFNSAGYYEFTYTVTSANCGNDSQQIEIFLFEVDISSSTTTCDYTLELTDPADTANTGVVELSMAANSTFSQATFKYIVQRDCTGTPETLDEAVSNIVEPNLIAGPNEFQGKYGRSAGGLGLPSLFVGDYIEEIVVRSTAAGLITINLSSVVYGGSISTFMAAIKTAIETYLSTTYSYTNGTHYFLTTTGASNSNYNIGFAMKNSPSGTWVGIDVNNAEVTFNNGASTTYFGNDTGFITHSGYVTTNTFPSPGYSTPCSTLQTAFQIGGTTGSMSDAADFLGMTLNYNSAVNIGTTPITYFAGTTASTCNNVPSLLASLFPSCSTSPFYEWYDAAVGGTLIGDTDTLVPPGAGTYRAEITCDTVVCSNTITV